MTGQSIMRELFSTCVSVTSTTFKVLRALLLFSLGVLLLANPALLTIFIVVEYFWRTFGLPRLVTYVSPTRKHMPLLIPWLCIPIPGLSVDWEPGLVIVNSPFAGNDPNSNAITPNCRSDWKLLAMLRGTDTLVLTNAIMDSEFHRSKKGIILKVPYLVSKELTPTWVKKK